MKTSDNKAISEVGAGTPMGEAMRRGWLPACLPSELEEPDGPPLRLKLLGEWFVAFRDSNGVVGVLDEACPHRGASLAFGRNEDCGLRCLWHGWKIGVNGRLQETPNIADEHFRARVSARSYDVVERGGFIWVHLGEGQAPPPPDFQWAHVPDENRLIVPVELDCNYTQPLEGLADSSHVGILHANLLSGGVLATKHGNALAQDQAPRLVVEPTDFGFHYAALRKVSEPEGGHHVRVTAYGAPFVFFIPPGRDDAGGQAFISVPQDDTHSRFYNVFWSDHERLCDGPGRQARLDMFGLHDNQLEENGMQLRYPLTGDLGTRNRFQQDRDAMRLQTSFSGLNGLTAEDAAMTDSMGAIATRSKEHLVPADLAVIRLRRTLLAIAREGSIGEITTDVRQIGAATAVIGPDDDWHELVPAHVVTGAMASNEDADAESERQNA